MLRILPLEESIIPEGEKRKIGAHFRQISCLVELCLRSDVIPGISMPCSVTIAPSTAACEPNDFVSCVHFTLTDAEAFNVHVEAGPMRIAFVFDAFRYVTLFLFAYPVLPC
jgi:hypothetical protein